MSTSLLEIVDLGDGEVVLQRVEGDSEPLVSIQFSEEANTYLMGNNLEIAKVMIQAGIEAAAQLAEVNNLESGTSYTFRVEAGDAAGNWSTTGPSAQVTTTEVYDPGFRRLTSEQFQRALADVTSTLWREGCQRYMTAKGWEGEG